MANDQELIKEVYPISILRASQQNKDEGEHWISEDVTKKWTDNPQGVSPEYPYEFCCTRYYTYKNKSNPSEGKGWQPWDIKNISLWAHYGMNATPYLLLLGNPYESIYLIEASGATREAYVIIDGDGISTGEIILLGGYENKDQKFNLKIDEISILDPISNIEHHFEKTNNYLTINLGDNWKCRFERSNNNGNPVIKIIGIGPNPESAVTPPSTIELAPTDSCFKCDLGGKYQKKIIIQAKNNLKHITATATWTVTAIRDKNGDGIWRYKIMPNIDRVVKMSYFKKISDSLSNHIRSVYNIGDAESVTFDIEKDTYGLAWRNITNQACRVVIKNPLSGNTITVPANGGPITVPFVQLRSELDAISNANPTLTQTLQYTVELQVVDPDYEANSEGYSVVDKCNLLFEYIVCEAGKDGEDGEDGKNGVSTMFNLSNDNGTFAYDYHTGDIIVNPKDNSTEIQYSENSNYVCCTSLTIGTESYTGTSNGVYDRVHFSLVKGEKFWTLTVNSIDGDGDGDPSTYTQLFSLPIKGFKEGKEVGSATFKMSGVKDLNEDGVYLYRLIPEHQHSSLKPHPGDYLDVLVFRDELVKGNGYNENIPILVEAISKEDNSTLGVISGTVSCATPAELLGDNLVSMATIQGQKGAIIKVYAKDPDYEDRPEFSNDNKKYSSYSNQGYYYTGEYEEVSWTAPGGSTPEITEEQIAAAVKIIVCNNNNIIVAEGATYNFTFKDVSGNPKNVNISGIPTNIFTYKTTTANGVTSLALTSESDLSTVDPTSGEIKYEDPSNSDIYGTIRYAWIGDLSHDGVYYTYDMSPSARVIGYNDDGTFTPKLITVTCYRTEYGNGSKKITPGTGYIGINDEKDISKLKSLNSSGLTDIEIGKDYTGTTAFTIRWYAIDDDLSASDPNFAFEENGQKYYMVDEQPIDIVPTKVILAEAVTNYYKMVGQASRIRNYASLGTGTNYFYPTGYEMATSNGDNDNIYEGISDSGTTIFFPKYYDILSYYDDTTKTTTYYRCVKYQKVTNGKPSTSDLKNTEFWTSAQMEDFMAIDLLIANLIAAKTVEADKLLVRATDGQGTIEAGIINGKSTLGDGQTNVSRDRVVMFAGLPPNADSLTDASFYVQQDGTVHMSKGSIGGEVSGIGGGSGESSGLTEEQVLTMIDDSVNFSNVKKALEEGSMLSTTPLKLAVLGNILALALTLAPTETSFEDTNKLVAWFKFENVTKKNGDIIFSPVLYWNSGGQLHHLDFTDLIVTKLENVNGYANLTVVPLTVFKENTFKIEKVLKDKESGIYYYDVDNYNAGIKIDNLYYYKRGLILKATYVPGFGEPTLATLTPDGMNDSNNSEIYEISNLAPLLETKKITIYVPIEGIQEPVNYDLLYCASPVIYTLFQILDGKDLGNLGKYYNYDENSLKFLRIARDENGDEILSSNLGNKHILITNYKLYSSPDSTFKYGTSVLFINSSLTKDCYRYELVDKDQADTTAIKTYKVYYTQGLLK